ncbi:hypothetical protein [Thorsellia kenyensis]|uniref:Lipoprotein n=1 Tax=Thorsellia kenyensis TaxID=1549888 RepID=A0ABV6C7Z6_9GAMM
MFFKKRNIYISLFFIIVGCDNNNNSGYVYEAGDENKVPHVDDLTKI